MNAVPLAVTAARSGADGPRLLAPWKQLSSQQLLDWYRARRDVQLFTIVDAEETGRERIDDIVAGRFQFNGEPHVLGNTPDWLANPSVDVEWHILLHKFYYAVGLGMAWEATGERRYVDAWLRLTASWITQTPPGFIAADVTGRRVQNWIYAWQHFVTRGRPAPVPAEFHRRLLASIEQQVDYLCENLTPKRNHRTLELYAIVLAGIAFPEFASAARWREFGLAELGRNIDADLLPDGVHCELSTDYHHLVVKNYLAARRLAQLNGHAVPAALDRGLERALEFSMHVHRPDGIVPALSDGDARSYEDLLQAGADLFGRDDFRYVATRGSAGAPPADTLRVFPASGYAVVRSGWGQGARAYADEHWLVFDAGPLGEGNHGHLDCLSFELHAAGQSLVVDPGRYTYSEAGPVNWRVRFRGTAAHNTVTIDGRNQTRYEPKVVTERTRHQRGSVRHRIQGPAPDARLLHTAQTRGHALLVGEARSHEYPVRHVRHLLFVGDAYWVVVDRLEADETHDYDQRFQLHERAQDATRIVRADGVLRVESPGLVLGFDAAAVDGVSVDPSCLSRSYGSRLDAPTVRAHRRAASTWLHAALLPAADAVARLEVEVLPVTPLDEPAGGDARRSAFALRVATPADGNDGDTLVLIGSDDGRRWRCGEQLFAGITVRRRRDAGAIYETTLAAAPLRAERMP